MKCVLLTIESQRLDWNEQVTELYNKKINQLKIDFQIQKLKSPRLPREEKKIKIQKEGETILGYLKKDDYAILFDEAGKELNSTQFANQLKNIIESNPKRVVFIIGGAFGASDAIKTRAQQKISLSPLTLNHLVAQTLALEQIYRGLTILKAIPYHNE